MKSPALISPVCPQRECETAAMEFHFHLKCNLINTYTVHQQPLFLQSRPTSFILFPTTSYLSSIRFHFPSQKHNLTFCPFHHISKHSQQSLQICTHLHNPYNQGPPISLTSLNNSSHRNKTKQYFHYILYLNVTSQTTFPKQLNHLPTQKPSNCMLLQSSPSSARYDQSLCHTIKKVIEIIASYTHFFLSQQNETTTHSHIQDIYKYKLHNLLQQEIPKTQSKLKKEAHSGLARGEATTIQSLAYPEMR